MRDLINLFYRLLPVKEIIKCRELSQEFLYMYRSLNVIDLINKYPIKDGQKKILYYVAFYSYLPPQRSKKWLSGRIGDIELKPVMIPASIGGSEVSAVIGESKYGGEEKIIAAKLGIDGGFNSSISTRWGKMLEPVVRHVNSLRFKTKIYEVGAVPNISILKYGFPLVRYSTDGIACVKFSEFKKILGQEDPNLINSDEFLNTQKKLESQNRDYIMLNFEIKCPLMTIPNGEVPKNYRAQPKTGSNTLLIIDMNIFINNLFRKCSIKDFCLSNNKYDKNLHKYYSRKIQSPLYCGFVGLYSMAKKTPYRFYCDQSITNIKSLILHVSTCIKTILTTKSSEFYGLVPTEEGLSKYIYIAWKFLPAETKFNNKLRFTVIWNIVRMCYKNVQSFKENNEKYKAITENTLTMIDEASHKFNLSELSYGDDLGAAPYDDFCDVMEKWDSNLEMQMYYPENYYFPVGHLWGMTHGDLTLQEEDRAKHWLWHELYKFCNFCSIKNYTPIGVIPWKIFASDYLPMYDDKNFLRRYEPKIRQVTDRIEEIKKKALKDGGPYQSEQYKKICWEEMTKYYPQYAEKNNPFIKKFDPESEKPDPSPEKPEKKERPEKNVSKKEFIKEFNEDFDNLL
jgi:hypothetical protein